MIISLMFQYSKSHAILYCAFNSKLPVTFSDVFLIEEIL